MISLGIGDPDRPTPALVVEAMQEAVTEAETHRYPSNRGREDFRAAVCDFYSRRFDVALDPEREIIPAIGAKEAIFNLNLAFLDPGDYALAADPGYPVYTGGPWLAGAEPVLMALRPEHGFAPDLEAIDAGRGRPRAADVPQLPQQPHGCRRPGRLLRAGRRVRPRARHPRGPRQLLQRDHLRRLSRAVVPGTPGAKDVGIEVFSLSKGYNMTGWRCAVVVGNAEALEIYWRLKTNIDSGLFEAIQLAASPRSRRTPTRRSPR